MISLFPDLVWPAGHELGAGVVRMSKLIAAFSNLLLFGQGSARQDCNWGNEAKAFKPGDQLKNDFGTEEDMKKRDALLKSLGIKLDGLSLAKSLTYDFIRPPQSKAA